MTYQDLLRLTAEPPTAVLGEPSTTPPADEIEIQSHWFAGHFPRQYTSNLNQKITIISPGEWNRGPGPDFLSATIEIDGQTHHGPIELDLTAQNWDLHGHRQSPHFDPVILHVVFHEPPKTFFTQSLTNRNIPRILIPPDQLNTALGRPRLTQTRARPGRCLNPLANLNPTALHALLKQSALHRAQTKATRFHQTAKLHSFSQALWEHLADALGYSANRLPMRLLAQRLPIHTLLKLPPEDRHAILFGTAGFLSPTLHQTAPPDSQSYLESLWTCWWKHRQHHEFPPDRLPAWSTRNTRPGNHPHRRLAALATAAEHWPSLSALARQAPPFPKFTKALRALTHPFWAHHHTLLSQATPKPIALLGASRVHEFLINSLFPLHLEPQHWDTYAKIPATTTNQKTKRCAERLFGTLKLAQPHLKHAWQHQALLQIYQDFCLEDLTDCQQCPFPEQLTQWNSTHD